MQAYSLNTRVDVTAGLPWLEVCKPTSESTRSFDSNFLGEKFGIMGQGSCEDSNGSTEQRAGRGDSAQSETYQYIYPAHLRHHEPLAFLKTGFCSPILDKFTFKSRQSFHRPPIHYSKDELLMFIKRGMILKQYEDMVDEVDLKIDLLHFTLDSYQFKTTFDIIRNVLLEPPKPRRDRTGVDENEPQPPSSRIRVSSAAAAEMEEILANDHSGKQGREKLRSAAINLLRDLEDRHAIAGNVITRRVSYTLKKLVWCINSPDLMDNVEIAFTGFFGRHEYSSDGSVSTQFGLEDVRVACTKPGPDSICFPDPTSVIKPVLDVERSPCQMCGKPFDHSINNLNSCSYHDGTFGSGIWSCCKSSDMNSLGCKHAPHTGKERAAIVRVETLPRIVEGITLYSHFEVIIYPESHHITAVQISKSLAKLFMNYFFVGIEDEAIDTKTAEANVNSSNESISNPPDTGSLQKALLIGGKSPYSSEPTHPDDDESEIISEASTQAELVLMKVWRVGYINAEISFAGFRRIPQRTVDIRVNSYSKSYKLGSWAYLGQKYLTYLIHETVKSGASSAIFRRKITGGAADHQSNQTESFISKPAQLEASNKTFFSRHLKRPAGAETFLGTTPSRHSKSKAKVSFTKK
jgi:hypothetical protein